MLMMPSGGQGIRSATGRLEVLAFLRDIARLDPDGVHNYDDGGTYYHLSKSGGKISSIA
jgi:hypothetical protein